MAKVKGPLFSFDARGKLGKAVVFMAWKGINDIRQYVIPANPRTTAQQAQRTKMAEAVEQWHNPNLDSDDKKGWDILASIAPKPMSGFNRFVKQYIDIKVAGKDFVLMYDFTVSSPAEGQIDVSVKCGAAGKTVKVRYGTSKTSLLEETTLTDNGDGSYSVSITGLDSGVRYYLQCFISAPESENMNITGILPCTTK